MRRSGAAEKCLRLVLDMHERCAVGMTEIKAEAEPHQGSGLSSFLFTEESDSLTDEVRQESPRTWCLQMTLWSAVRAGRYALGWKGM